MKTISKAVLVFLVCVLAGPLVSQTSKTNTVAIHADQGRDTISRNIYGQFSEHLGHCIYGGIWVGEQSTIPNTRGIRNDVVAALKNIKIPNLRWPGGCFADEYHWMDGIGPRSQRPKMVNTNWGGVTEDNSFGTHEFMDLCTQLGCEPVICGNLGSGTVKEMADWVQYLTSDGENPMSALRKKNGRAEPWKVKFWGVGNESWGCGGIMSPDGYASELAKYSFFLKNYGSNSLYKISSGGLENDTVWTETVMKKRASADGWLKSFMSGYSLHYYTVCNTWDKKGSATDFDEKEWFQTMSKTIHIEDLIRKHSVVMDKYDPKKEIGLIVDEWGNWHDVEPGTNPGFLFQQNTMRDAIVAALNLNIFHKHCDRVKMTNIAQIVNVLQSVILTDGPKMVLTPTYHVYDLYKVHQDAVMIPVDVVSEEYTVDGGTGIPAISASASVDAKGVMHISLVNVNPSKPVTVRCNISGAAAKKITGRILTSVKMQDHNTFEKPNAVGIHDFSQFKTAGGELQVEMPSKSIVVLEVQTKP
ncbi:MAG TPA: alpha-N-arabinofuranosidase [Bacteroidota bacterium]|nr:alpha-N-arabinofuranosidase [Bacteroidota bacterium]